MTAPLFGVAQANFDARKFSYLGNIAKEPNFCVSWATSPITNFDQIMAREEFIVGAAGAGGTIETVPIIMNNLLGTNIKVIGGYPSGTAVLLAMERGELHGRCGWSMSSMMGSHPDWFKEKKIIVAREFDECNNCTFDDQKARLDNLAVELQNDQFASGYIIAYGGRTSPIGQVTPVPPSPQ